MIPLCRIPAKRQDIRLSTFGLEEQFEHPWILNLKQQQPSHRDFSFCSCDVQAWPTGFPKATSSNRSNWVSENTTRIAIFMGKIAF
jgi:hypothetical protein